MLASLAPGILLVHHDLGLLGAGHLVPDPVTGACMVRLVAADVPAAHVGLRVDGVLGEVLEHPQRGGAEVPDETCVVGQL